jgi:phosphatidyl-myo-inositol dimannoside synthase
MDKKLRILFITRKYPPSIGGMQRFHFELAQALGERLNLELIAKRAGDPLGILFIGRSVWRLLAERYNHRADVLLLGDPLLGLLYPLIKWSKRPVVLIVHGLDIVYTNPVYQWLRKSAFNLASRIIAISPGVAELSQRALEESKANKKIDVIAPGFLCKKIDHQAHLLNRPKQLRLLTVGRLVERKGQRWFVENVIQKLIESGVTDMSYHIVGGGDDLPIIQKKIVDYELQNHVFLHGEVSESAKAEHYQNADLVVLPNLRVANDYEGFGLVALEASCFAKYVLASDIEGLRASVVEGMNGERIAAADALAWIEKILQINTHLSDYHARGAAAQQWVQDEFCWKRKAAEYEGVFRELCR